MNIICYKAENMILIYIFVLSDSVRAFKERNKMGRFADVDPEKQRQMEEEKKRKEEEEIAHMATMSVGARLVV